MSRKLTLNEIENSLDNNAMYVFEYDEQHNIEYETLCLYCSTEEGEVFFTDRCGNLYAYSKETYGTKWDCEASNACVYDDEPMTKKILQRTEEALSFPNASSIVLTKHGEDDWEVYYPYTDFSIRGTKQDALDEIKDILDVNDKGGN